MGKLVSHANSEGNPEHYQLLGRLTVAWASLDYVLRVALKRKMGIKLYSSEADQIFGKLPHGALIEKLRSAYSDVPGPLTELNKVGNKRGEGLYRKRNQYVHALWAEDSTGQDLRQRIGADEWRKPFSFEEGELQGLIKTIEKTARSINDISRVNS